jgi:hypothetical protein
MHEIEISNWDELSIYFSKIFNNLGNISIDEKYLTFSSFPEDVNYSRHHTHLIFVLSEETRKQFQQVP